MFKLGFSFIAMIFVWPNLGHANIQVHANFKANMIVSEQGTQVSQSGGPRCNHGGGKTKRKTINSSWHQKLFVNTTLSGDKFAASKGSRINLDVHPQLAHFALKGLSAEPIDPRLPHPQAPGQTPQPSKKQIEEYETAIAAWKAEKQRRLKLVKHDTDDFRKIFLSGGVKPISGGGHSLSLVMKDQFSKDIDNNWNSKCWRAEDNYYRHGSNTLDGFIHVKYTLPKGSQFLKLTVNESQGLLVDKFLEGINGSLIPAVRLTKNQYIWVLGKSEEQRRTINIRFKYTAHAQNSSGSGITHQSKLGVQILPLRAADPSISTRDRFMEVANLLAEGQSAEADLIPEIAPLIEKEKDFLSTLRGFTLREIREFQDVFLTYALRATQDGDVPKSPFVKAMVAVVATKISEDLSNKLLPVCVVESTVLPVLRKEVKAQRYVFMMFYLQRMIDRLSNYKPLNTFAVVNVMKDQQDRGLSYKQVASNTAEQEKLKDAYEIFLNIAQVQQQPARTSGGEFQELSRFAKAFVSTSEEYQPILKSLEQAAVVEHKIYRALQAQKRSYLRNPEDTPINVDELMADIGALDGLVKKVSADIGKMTQNHLFSEVDVRSFSETMFRVFEGLNIVSSDQMADVDVKDYYTPIFNHFFDPAQLAELSKKAQLCLSGQLEAE